MAVVSHLEWFRQPGFRIARSMLHSPVLMLLHISSKYRWSVLKSCRFTLGSCSISFTGSNEQTGCSLHVIIWCPIDPENPRWPVVAPSSASNKWRRGSSFVWRRHTSHCRGRLKFTSSRRITPALCPVLTFVPSHPTTFIFSVFTFRSFKQATNDSVMFLLEPDDGVVWLKYAEPGSEMMLMCSSVTVFLWYLLLAPRTCVKVWSLRPSKNTPSIPVWPNWSSFCWNSSRVFLRDNDLTNNNTMTSKSLKCQLFQIGGGRSRSCQKIKKNLQECYNRYMTHFQHTSFWN